MIRTSQLALAIAMLIGSSAAFAVTNNVQANYGTVTPPTAKGFSNTFVGLGGGNYVDATGHTVSDSTAQTLSLGGGATGTATFNFYDDYLFTMPTTAGGSLAASAMSLSFGNLFGINNLQARFYEVPATGLTTGRPATLISAWSTATNVGGNTITVSTFENPINLVGGATYAMEVRGQVFGAAGSYGGSLNISAVPEAESWALALVGLGVAGVVARRRASAAV
jgi:MYXO-CTERM domain-containing protein